MATLLKFPDQDLLLHDMEEARSDHQELGRSSKIRNSTSAERAGQPREDMCVRSPTFCLFHVYLSSSVIYNKDHILWFCPLLTGKLLLLVVCLYEIALYEIALPTSEGRGGWTNIQIILFLKTSAT